jgi:uncharacterized PurR-regulated membrane protein YhhQ (DUF165 family)
MKKIHEHYHTLDKQYSNSIKPLKLKTFKAYPFIIAIMAVLQLSSIIYSRYFTDFLFGFKITLGPLIFTPMILFIFQIVSECYGWQYARQIVWCDFIINTFFALITFLIKLIPISLFTHENLRQSYINLMDTMWVSAAVIAIAVFFADYCATILMSQSRYYFKGRWLFLRLIIVHCVTELILLSVALIQMPYNGYTIEEAFRSMYQMFIARAISVSCLAPFVMFIIWFIQNRIEKVVSFDAKKNWNIFKWSIEDRDTLQFDSKQWSKLSAQEKLKLDIPAMTVEYYANLDADHIASGSLKDKDSYAAKVANMLDGNYESAARAKQMQQNMYNKNDNKPFFHEGYSDKKR